MKKKYQLGIKMEIPMSKVPFIAIIEGKNLLYDDEHLAESVAEKVLKDNPKAIVYVLPCYVAA